MKKSASSSILISSERSTRGNQVEQFLIKSFEVIEQSRKCGCTSFFSSCSSSVAYPPSDLNSLVTKLNDVGYNCGLASSLRRKLQGNSLFELLQREGPSICIGTNLEIPRGETSRVARVTLELWYIQVATPARVPEPALMQCSPRLASALKSLIAITRALPASRLLRSSQPAPLPPRVQQLRRPVTSPRLQKAAESSASRSDPIVPSEMVSLRPYFCKKLISTDVGVTPDIHKTFFEEFQPTAIEHTRCASVILSHNFMLQVGCYYLSSEAITAIVKREALNSPRCQSFPVSINASTAGGRSSMPCRNQSRRSLCDLPSSSSSYSGDGDGESSALHASPIRSDPTTLNPLYEHEDEAEAPRQTWPSNTTRTGDAPAAAIANATPSSAIAVPSRRGRTTSLNAHLCAPVAYSADARLPLPSSDSPSPRAMLLAQRNACDEAEQSQLKLTHRSRARRSLEAALYEREECRQVPLLASRDADEHCSSGSGPGSGSGVELCVELPSPPACYTRSTLEQMERARIAQIEATGLDEPLKFILLASECEIALGTRRLPTGPEPEPDPNEAARQPSMVASALAWCLHKSRRRTSSTARELDAVAVGVSSRKQSTASASDDADADSETRSTCSMSASRALWQRFKQSRNTSARDRDETYRPADEHAAAEAQRRVDDCVGIESGPELSPRTRTGTLTTSMIFSRIGRFTPHARLLVTNALASGATPSSIARSPPADFVLLDAPGVPSATTDAGCEDLLTRYLQRWSAGRAASGALSRVDLKFRGRSKLGEHLTTIDAAVKGEYNASAFFAEFDTAYQLRAQQEDEELECPD